MRLTRVLVLLAIYGFSASSEQWGVVSAVSTQAPSSGVQFSPVPLWPPDGVVPPQLAKRYVFYDVDAEEYVLAYSENLGTSEFERNPGKLVVRRFPTTRGARPTLDFSVEPADGKFRYTYRVSNQSGAKKPITTLAIATPVLPDGRLTAPPEWKVIAVPSSIAEVGNALGQPRMTGAFVFWVYTDDPSAIAAGKTLENFSVVSSYKPGMSAGYFRAGPIETPPSDIPDAVVTQLGPVMSMAFNAQSVLVVAPRFPAGTPRERIAQDFHAGIRRMIDATQLNSQSPVVGEMLERLVAYYTSVEVFRNVPLTLGQKPTSDTERALQQALVLAMN